MAHEIQEYIFKLISRAGAVQFSCAKIVKSSNNDNHISVGYYNYVDIKIPLGSSNNLPNILEYDWTISTSNSWKCANVLEYLKCVIICFISLL